MGGGEDCGQRLILDARHATLVRWEATWLANVAPSGRNSMLLSYPGLRRPPGASPGVTHGAALRAELGRSDDMIYSRFGPYI